MAPSGQNISKTKIGGKLALGGLVVAVVLLGVYLFAGDRLLYSLGNGGDLHGASRDPSEVLTIGYAFNPPSLEPTHFDPLTRSRLVDVYEGLVLTNRNLKLEPGLAVSWGLIDSLTWEFRLRPDVTFHDGRPMRAEDVIYSLERAVGYEGSQLRDLLSTVEGVELSGSDRIRIHTEVPDPLLLQKMALVYIFPEGYDTFDVPMGTGPYRFVSKENGTIKLQRNPNYWGPLPAFSMVELIVIESRRDRLAALEEGRLKVLNNLPPSAGCGLIDGFHNTEGCDAIQGGDIQVKSIPSLQVSYLSFNFDHELFGLHTVREALSKSFDSQVFIDIAFGFAKPADQFVSSGVFGFNPAIEQREYDLEEARKLMDSVIGSSFERIVVTFDYPQALQPVGEYVQQQLGELGIDVILNPLSDRELQERITSGESELFYLGWRSELGDAVDFLQAVAHSDGLFNGANYSNMEVDRLIEESTENLEEEERLLQMQEAMEAIVEEDIIGVPLFESETIFAFQKDIQFEPRVDGYVFASEIK